MKDGISCINQLDACHGVDIRRIPQSYFVCGESDHQCEDSEGDSVIWKSFHSLTFAKKPREPFPSSITQELGEGTGTWPSLEVDLSFPNSLSYDR